MTDTILNQEYITQDMLDEAMEKVNQKIQDLTDDVAKKVESALRKSEEALDEERKAREKAIEAIQEKTDKRLDAIDTKLEKLDDISNAISSIQGGMEGWQQTLESVRNLHQQNSDAINKSEKRIDDMRDDVDSLTQKQTQSSEKINQLHKTVHGDTNEDGPDSVFGLLRELKMTFEQNTQAQHALIAGIQDKVAANATAITVINTKNGLLKEWRDSFRSTIAKILSNKFVLGFLLILLGGMIFGPVPELLSLALTALKAYMGVPSTPGG